MNSIAARWGRSSSRVGALAVAAAALLGALVPAAANAESAPESLYGPSMNLTFSRANVRVAGTGAVVSVKCKGPRSGSCAGTVSLHFAGATRKVAFSVAGGHRQRLVVPLGADRERIARRGKRRVRAIARTVQPLGSCRESTRLLRLK